MSSKKEKNKKYALGGKSQLGNTPTGWLGTIQPGNPFDIMDKEQNQNYKDFLYIRRAAILTWKKLMSAPSRLNTT